MGNLAASGGYWISTASDEIWASPDTITGSIGIFGMFPTLEKPLEKYLGVRVDGVGTNWLAGALNPARPLDPRAGELIQSIINDGYQDFLKRVAEARKKPVAEIDRIARGRIWSGADAKRLGLVDQLGGVDQAIASAGKRAKIEGKPRVVWVEKELTWQENLAREVFSSAAPLLGKARAARGNAATASLRKMEKDLQALAAWNDPNGVYAHCMCGGWSVPRAGRPPGGGLPAGASADAVEAGGRGDTGHTAAGRGTDRRGATRRRVLIGAVADRHGRELGGAGQRSALGEVHQEALADGDGGGWHLAAAILQSERAGRVVGLGRRDRAPDSQQCDEDVEVSFHLQDLRA